jgi:GTPase SAR1 family protein
MSQHPPERVINWADASATNFNQWKAYSTEAVVKIVIGASPKQVGGTEPLEIDLNALAEWLPKFGKLTHLYLWNIRGLDALPPLPSGLKCLDVRGCEALETITRLPDGLEKLLLEDCPKLRWFLVPNQLPELMEASLAGSTVLKQERVHAVLRAAPKLGRFDASRIPHLQQVKQWPETLTRIDLNDCCKLMELPVKWPSGLRRLGLSRASQVRTVPKLPSSADYIDLSGTAALVSLPDMEGRARTLFLHGSGVGLRDELLGKSETHNVAAPVFDYLDEINRSGKVVDPEVKVILLGNGRCGKSSLARALEGGKFDPHEPSTHGVRLGMTSMKVLLQGAEEEDSVLVNIWDFAGQSLYHSTHRLFFQSRAVFVICGTDHGLGSDNETDEREDQTCDPEDRLRKEVRYWLSQVESVPGLRSGERPPVIFVRTKSDRDGEPEGDGGATYWQTISDAVKGRPLVESFSAKTGVGLDDLKEILREQIGKVLGSRHRQLLPKSVKKLKDKLRELISKNETEFRASERAKRKASPPFPTLPYFQDPSAGLGEAAAVESFEALAIRFCPGYPLERVTQLLHDGGFFYYSAERLRDRVILDQRWALDGIYALTERGGLLREHLIKGRGRATQTEMAALAWARPVRDGDLPRRIYQPAEQNIFIAFMLACGTCFELLTKAESASRETLFAFPAFFPHELRETAYLEDKPWHKAEWAATEDELRNALCWIGETWGRTADYALTAAVARAETSRACVCLAWKSEKDGSFLGRLELRFFGPRDDGFARHIIADLRERLGLSADESLVAGLGSDRSEVALAEHLGSIEAGREGPTQKLSELSTAEAAAASGLSRSYANRSRPRVCFSYAGSDHGHPGIGELPKRVGELLVTADTSVEVWGYQVASDEAQAEERLSQFTHELAAGDLALVFWSLKYWRSLACMAELMHIYQSPPKGRFPHGRVAAYYYPNSRLTTIDVDSELNHEKVDKFWENELNIRTAKIRTAAESHEQRPNSRHERRIEVREPLKMAWFNFVSNDQAFGGFLANLVDYRLARRLPDTFDIEAQAEKIVADVRLLLEGSAVLVDRAMECWKTGDQDRAVQLVLRLVEARNDGAPGNDPAASLNHWSKLLPAPLLVGARNILSQAPRPKPGGHDGGES